MHRLQMILIASLSTLLWPIGAAANPEDPGLSESYEPSRNYLNLRVGASTTALNGRPTICGEVAPFRFVSLEACGTGSGLLHRDPDPEVAHFRLPITPYQMMIGSSTLRFRAAPGFAELQIGVDAVGFEFDEPSEADTVETAGPEMAASIQMLMPLDYDVELVMDINGGAAWFPHADKLAVAMPRFQPFAEFTLGFGW